MSTVIDQKELWQEYQRNPRPELKHQIISSYLDSTKMLAATLYGKRPNDSVEFSDYYHYAIQGLLEAFNTYRYEKNDNFFAYARIRIKGAVLDGIALMTERSLQLKQKTVYQQRLASIYGDEPIGNDLFYEFVDISLSLAIGFVLESEQAPACEYYASTEQKELKEVLLFCLDALEGNEKTVLMYHYFYEVDFVSIAEMLGVSRSRVAQLHKSGLANVRSIYEKAVSVDVSY